MAQEHSNRGLKAAVLGLAVLASLGAAHRAWAQGHTPDPYNYVGEYNRGFEPYLYPSYPNDQGVVPNQAELEGGRSGVSRFNQYQNFLEDLDGGGGGPDEFATPRLRSLPGVPYYRAHRQFNSTYGRTYRPNANADRTFYEEQQVRAERHMRDQQAAREMYDRYLRERDPARRAQLYRDYIGLSQKAAREAGTSRGAPPLASRSAGGRTTVPPPLPPSTTPDPGPRYPARGAGNTARGRARASTAPPATDRRTDADSPRSDGLSPLAPPIPGLPDTSPGTSRTPSETLRESELLDQLPRRSSPTNPARRPARTPPSTPAPTP